jgi:hypothetical protein
MAAVAGVKAVLRPPCLPLVWPLLVDGNFWRPRILPFAKRPSSLLVAVFEALPIAAEM